jgi:TnsA endonuclease N terminal
MAYSGQFKPRNPQKYIGDPTNIVYRSSWEVKVMDWLDRNPDILSWASEELIIPYRSPVDSKIHRYFPDFLVKMRTREGKLKTMLLEVKPKKQTQEPEQRKRVTKQYINEVTTWGVNQAKWKAATEYCSDRGWEFMLITEDHLGLN